MGRRSGCCIRGFRAIGQSNDYVQVRDGRFVLGGRPYVAKGMNYFGSWRYNYTLKRADGIEQGNIWVIYHDWDTHKLLLDFQFMASQLNATAVRIGTPSLLNFESLVKFQGYEPWFNPDGTIAGSLQRTSSYRSQISPMLPAYASSSACSGSCTGR